MKITVIGCGRWGSLIAWYLDSIKHEVSLYGRKTSGNMQRFLCERKNDLLLLPETVKLTTELNGLTEAEVIIISVNSQGLQGLMDELKVLNLRHKIFVLCMKGIEISTGRRLSQVANDNLDYSNEVAV
jgi:glycerol-3-phosphate dehydrogenase (NAD(P)+)